MKLRAPTRTPSATLVSILILGLTSACGPSKEAAAPVPETVGAPEEASGAAVATSIEEQEEEPEPAARNLLAGTHWRLAELQSMDDSIGTTTPDDPSLYTMALNADGTVNMRLHCNRANGTWSAEPAGDGTSGSFEFSPLAMTRALCPPGSLDERIAKEAGYVRGFLLRDGQLHLSLMADGGILSWDPDDMEAEASQ